MTPSILTHFTKTVEDYDTVANKVVMKNDEIHDVLINAIRQSSDSRLEILDLGSGTGHGMKLMLKKYKYAKIYGIDFSPKMIVKSTNNLKMYSNRIILIEEDFIKFKFPKKYDVVVSAIAIHNSSHQDKKRLFEKILFALKPGGYFINADFIQGENDQIDRHYKMIYKQYLEQNLKGEELDIWIKHAFKDDQPMKLSDQFKYLKLAGFSNIQLIWQYNNEAIYKAYK